MLNLLNNTKFPLTTSRKNISDKPIESFNLGIVNYRGQKLCNYKTQGPSRHNDKYFELYIALQKLIYDFDKDFKYTTIQLNKNIKSPPHIDKNNIGMSYIIAFGDYTQGDLIIEGDAYNINEKFLKFNGRLGHWTDDFSGQRYSIIYYTHTFKPPCPSLRNITVKYDGLYKNDKLIKSYKNSYIINEQNT